jgi:hypothetical protein
MKTLVWFVAASALMFAGSSHAADKKTGTKFPDTIKLNFDVLDKVYGIKIKSALVKEEQHASKTEMIFTLEFTKDVENVRALYETFAPSSGVPFRFNELPLVFYMFDEDNVVVGKIVIMGGEGEPSGVKGEAFRIFLSAPTETFQRTKRIEARLFAFPK